MTMDPSAFRISKKHQRGDGSRLIIYIRYDTRRNRLLFSEMAARTLKDEDIDA